MTKLILHGSVVQWLVGALCVKGCPVLVEIYGVLVVDCAPDSKECNMRCDFVIPRQASEAPCL